MQLTDTIKNCNGCEACTVVCKYRCIQMMEDQNGKKVPFIQEGGCSKCNACKLYCPLFNPVELPKFNDYYEPEKAFEERKMAQVYRETMRNVRAGQRTEFVGTLCQIAGLKSLLGDKLPSNLVIYPIYCDENTSRTGGCEACSFR